MSSASSTAWLDTAQRDGYFVVEAHGRWDISNVDGLDRGLRRLTMGGAGRVLLDMAGVERLDTAGAWLLCRTAEEIRTAGGEADFANTDSGQQLLLERVARQFQPCEIAPPSRNPLLQITEQVGISVVDALRYLVEFVGFVGLTLSVLGRTVRDPRRLRLTPMVYQMEQVGLNAVPIVGLISFLIGIVLAYQGADQLRKFGAEVFVVELISLSLLREIGILLTAIVIAGRSGSSFTAQIGSMKLNEEVDAMRTLGLDPMEVLVLPRLLALLIMLPGLAFLSDMLGLVGGALMSWAQLGISPAMFIERFHQEVGLWTFLVGIIKAPVFALIIATVGCSEGFRVEGSAESVGTRTTQSVVKSIFLVIVGDALFSIFFSTVGV